MRNARRNTFTIFILLLVISAPAYTVYAVTPEELKAQIEARNKELDEINKQLLQTQGVLADTQVRGKTLSQEIGRIDKNISQTNLGIRKSEVLIDKLGLEITGLENDIAVKEADIASHRESMTGLIRNFQAKDGDSMLVTFLKNKTLVAGLAETQAISDLNSGLLAEVLDIQQLKTQLSDTLSQVSDKKQSVQTENKTLKVKKSIAEDQRVDKQTLLSSTKNQEKAYQAQVSDLEKRQQEIGAEINKIEAQLRAEFDQTLLPSEHAGVLGYPVANPLVVQAYGATAFAARAYSTQFHNGLDFRASVGTPIFAADDGQVYAVGDNGRVQYGRYIVIKHGNNLATLYGHLSRQVVVTGDAVTRGQLIGYSGSTGYSTGPHLHFGVYWGPSLQLKSFAGAGLVPVGTTINPSLYL